MFGLHVPEVRGGNSTRITGMAVIQLLRGFVAGDAQLFRIDDDDEIARVDVRRIDRLVLATLPRTKSVASITNHSCSTSAGLALKVLFMGWLDRIAGPINLLLGTASIAERSRVDET
jgi:hypothetical protein